VVNDDIGRASTIESDTRLRTRPATTQPAILPGMDEIAKRGPDVADVRLSPNSGIKADIAGGL